MKFNVPTYIIFFIIFICLSMMYKKLKLNEDTNTSAYYYKMVNKYLLNNNSLGMNNKPYLWIHLHNNNTIIPEVNSRNWIDFQSRNSKELNQPYQNLTIKSIIDKCGNDFNIALIDDNSFKKILPKWCVDLNIIANPIRTHIRLLALANILNIYGGIIVPSSFVCLKSLKSLYYANINENKMFVGEFLDKTSKSCSTSNSYLPSTELMGCNSNNTEMKDFINYLEQLNSVDFVAESDFVGKTNQWLNTAVNNQQINNINGLFIGTKKACGAPIFADELVESTYVDLHEDAVGLYIPWNELIQKTSLQWFVQMSEKQVLESNTVIGKRLLVNS